VSEAAVFLGAVGVDFDHADGLHPETHQLRARWSGQRREVNLASRLCGKINDETLWRASRTPAA
jgi:hypothetical protein